MLSTTHAPLSPFSSLSLPFSLFAHSNGRFKSKMKAPGSLMRLASTRRRSSRGFDILRWRANKKHRTDVSFFSFSFARENSVDESRFGESSAREERDIYARTISESRIRGFVRFIRSSARLWFLTPDRTLLHLSIYISRERNSKYFIDFIWKRRFVVGFYIYETYE